MKTLIIIVATVAVMAFVMPPLMREFATGVVKGYQQHNCTPFFGRFICPPPAP